jgi:hypothetical protein
MPRSLATASTSSSLVFRRRSSIRLRILRMMASSKQTCPQKFGLIPFSGDTLPPQFSHLFIINSPCCNGLCLRRDCDGIFPFVSTNLCFVLIGALGAEIHFERPVVSHRPILFEKDFSANFAFYYFHFQLLLYQLFLFEYTTFCASCQSFFISQPIELSNKIFNALHCQPCQLFTWIGIVQVYWRRESATMQQMQQITPTRPIVVLFVVCLIVFAVKS